MTESTRKIPFDLEGPIDIIFILISEKLNPIFKKLNFTPNYITTLSVIFKFITLYSFYYNKYLIATIAIILAYLFDCCDGSYARKYNMTSRLGDLYDHISDITYLIIFCILFLYKDIPKNIKYPFGVILFLSSILTYYYFVCTEEYLNRSKKKVSILNMFNFYKGDPVQCLRYTKYFSSGTINILGAILMLILHTNSNNS
jgi:phosphatidylglycerophosphate synthase